ncbi:MAG: DUF2851 family protein [Spartobacteria bacterium]|nr:DUF2851 family protein [Spartobacteria bacterium]
MQKSTAYTLAFDATFPLAQDFRHAIEPVVQAARVCDPHRQWDPIFCERHLQCIWYDDALRPPLLTDSHGEAVKVEHPGQWNLERGPDFKNATLIIGNNRRVCGDVEVHIRPNDWKHHGHQSNPAYNHVIAHITYYPGTVDPSLFPKNTHHISLSKPLRQMDGFSFDLIDLTAYPYQIRGHETPCRNIFSAMNPDDISTFLSAAGQERLRRKTQRMALEMSIQDPEQVIYQELMTGLGYKGNKKPFRKLACRLPIHLIRKITSCDIADVQAALVGMSGLLSSNSPSKGDAHRSFFNQIWDTWWRQKDMITTEPLTLDEWQLAHVRPLNHPLRRLLAMAVLIHQIPDVVQRVLSLENPPAGTLNQQAKQWIGHFQSVLGDVNDFHLTHPHIPIYGKRAVSLIGSDRINAMVINTLIPCFMAVSPGNTPLHAALLKHLPREQTNSIVRQTAFNLFGPNHDPCLYKTTLQKQGLLHIFQSFCLNDRTRCTECPLSKSCNMDTPPYND